MGRTLGALQPGAAEPLIPALLYAILLLVSTLVFVYQA
jgi:hypothetical protein